jgi:Bacterial Ig-like domain (group 2)
MKTGKNRSLYIVLLALSALTFIVVFSLQGCKVDKYSKDNVTLTSLSVTPTSGSMAGGTTLQLSATGTYSDSSTADLTSSVVWSSSDPTVTVSASGLVTAPQVTTDTPCTITATDESGMSESTVLTIRNLALTSLAISTSDSTSLDQGITAQFTATGTFGTSPDSFTQDITSSVTWASSSPDVATIDASGVVTGVAAGTTSITATFDSTTSNSVTVQVSGTALVSITLDSENGFSIGSDGTDYETATGHFSDNTTEDLTQSVTWTSSDTGVATIGTYQSNRGMGIVAVSPGTTTITATKGSVSGSADLTVETGAVY